MAPIMEPGKALRILDIGTGTGIWAIDIAEYVLSFELVHCMVTDAPLANFLVQRCWVDSLSAFPVLSTTSNHSILQASTLALCSQICKLCPAEFQLCKNCPLTLHIYRIPPNCEFVIDDLEREWTYPQGQKFDYIHQRGLVGCIEDWLRLYLEAIKHLKRNGRIEIQEFEFRFCSQGPGGLAEDSYIMRWQNLIDQASTEMRKRLNCAVELETWLKRAGFVDVTSEVIIVRIFQLHLFLSMRFIFIQLKTLTRLLNLGPDWWMAQRRISPQYRAFYADVYDGSPGSLDAWLLYSRTEVVG